jgi:hypothetical protein
MVKLTWIACHLPDAALNTLRYFTKNGCIPVRTVETVTDESNVSFKTMEFFGVVEGIADPNIFVPPRSCPP